MFFRKMLKSSSQNLRDTDNKFTLKSDKFNKFKEVFSKDECMLCPCIKQTEFRRLQFRKKIYSTKHDSVWRSNDCPPLSLLVFYYIRQAGILMYCSRI